MKRQTKELWTGTISYTAAAPIGGAMLRTNDQDEAADIIATIANSAFKQALRAVLVDAYQVSETNLWDDIEICMTLTIKPQTR